jgi:hypothetical protein
MRSRGGAKSDLVDGLVRTDASTSVVWGLHRGYLPDGRPTKNNPTEERGIGR